ncbi:MAG: CotH kinase family protein [Lachnoclostridium sp.]|jgi:hypothetical protein|nr:CotH kinase family protein [Lachnoclostridium sp.]
MKYTKRILGTLICFIVLSGILYSIIFRQDTQAADEVKAPTFSHRSGSYDDAFKLSLEAEEGDKIYYTTDGSIPLSKEEDDLKPPPSPIPSDQILPDAQFDISTDNLEFIDIGIYNDVEDGVELVFDYQYRSICFVTPDRIIDWTKYAELEIEYTANRFQNNRDVGLQFCYIYDWADWSWDEYSDHHNRAHEERALVNELGVRKTINFTLAGELSEIGKLMIGVTNPETNPEIGDSITIHSIKLIARKMGENIPTPKLPTQEYTNEIDVVNRQGQSNLLAVEQNINLMSQSNYAPMYYPTSAQVPKATVIRAMAVDEEGRRSEVVTRTYFVGNNIEETYKNASVMSIVTDRNNLLDPDIGIYRNGNYLNKGDEWERIAFVEYFDENGRTPFSTNMGIRIHGGYTRHYPQKSFNLYFREEIGLKNLSGYNLIPGATTADGAMKTKYKKFMLRNGGNDTEYTKLQDTFIQNQVSDRAFTTKSTRPCVMFLNGEYWGLYNLTEKYSDNYLEEEFKVDKDNTIIIKDSEVDEGNESDLAYYTELMNLSELDMTVSENYQKFCDMVDIESCIDYYATEIFIDNYDFDPAKNYQLWRTRNPVPNNPYGDTKWRWMLYDTEYSMGLYGNYLGDSPITAIEEKDRLFRAIIRNSDFRNQFISVMCDLMNVNFKVTPDGDEPSEMLQNLDRYAELYLPLQQQYFERFGFGRNQTNVNQAFTNQIRRIKSFLDERRALIVRDLKMQMNAGSSAELKIKSNAATEIKMNTVTAKLYGGEWDGIAFHKIPIQVSAPDVEGYRFVGWNADGLTVTSPNEQVTTVTTEKYNPVLEAKYQSLNGEDPSPEPSDLPPSADVSTSPLPSALPPTASVAPTPSSPQKTAVVTQTPSSKEKQDLKSNNVPKVKIQSIKSKKKKSFVAVIKKSKKITGCQMVYSMDKKLKKSTKRLSFETKRIVVKKLKAGKKYYVKVRGFVVNESGRKIYGGYSKIRAVRVK